MAEAEEGSEDIYGDDDAPENEGGEEGAAEEAAPEEAPAVTAVAAGSFLSRSLRWILKWHPFLFLGVALVLAAAAWLVYPTPEDRVIPPADALYQEGCDHLFRVLNPDLALTVPTPADEALAARNAFLNLFVFHRATLGQYPRFINPHLLLAEANRLLAEFNPAMTEKYYGDASAAYSDAQLWENREDIPERLAQYAASNYLGESREGADGVVAAVGFFDSHAEDIAYRRGRRLEYIRFRQAEADLNLNRPDLARIPLEAIQKSVLDRRREARLRSIEDSGGADDHVPHAFELGPDDFVRLDLLLARTYDGLGQLDKAKAGYVRFLATADNSRDHAFVVARLADIAMDEGEVYRRANPAVAEEAYHSAARYFEEIASSPSATREQRAAAILGSARANSRLADLVPVDGMTEVDEINALGRTMRGWLEDFSGQPLPRRTLALPMAAGLALSKPELVVPSPLALQGTVAGTVAAMAGGALETPYEKRRRYLSLALENYDRTAEQDRGSEAGDRAAVLAAWESWRLERKDEAEKRFERMLDPLSSDELILAARLGLATIALDRGDLKKARMLILGGYAHPSSLWFTPADADWRKFAARLGNPGARAESSPLNRVWESLPEGGREIATYAASGRRLDDEHVNRLLRFLNAMLRRSDFYQAKDFPVNVRNFHLDYVLSLDPERLTDEEVVWRNRMLMEEAWPYDLAQRALKDNIGFAPFPPAREFLPNGLLDPDQVLATLMNLARAWAERAAAAETQPERYRLLWESNDAYQAALDKYAGDPGEILYAKARNYENLAEIREMQGNHREALSLTAAAARSYMDVSLRARGSVREMDSLLAAGDAFFRSGLLERTVESQSRFLERFGYSSLPGTEAAVNVVRAENLLGRAYWFLNDIDQALASFRRNVARRTPDRYKSMYYIGRVLMDQGVADGDMAKLGNPDDPLPALDRNGDPVITSALQAFNHLRQSPGITPYARAWRWSTFDLARLRFVFAEIARKDWERKRAESNPATPEPTVAELRSAPWPALYDQARVTLTEALDRYLLRRTGGAGVGVSIRVEPEDYADTMAARFEAEYLLARTLLILAEARGDESLAALGRTHLANLSDRTRYANALFDVALDRFQLNSAVIREEVEGGSWDRNMPLPRTRLGDDEGPTHSPYRLRDDLRNGLQMLAGEYFRAGDLAAAREGGAPEAEAQYRRAYETFQEIYDRFGASYGSLAMLGMGDALARMGRQDDAANHYRMAQNIAKLQPADTRSDGSLDIGPAFWSDRAADRLRDRAGGYRAP